MRRRAALDCRRRPLPGPLFVAFEHDSVPDRPQWLYSWAVERWTLDAISWALVRGRALARCGPHRRLAVLGLRRAPARSRVVP